MHRADLAAAVRAALESSCPGSRTELLGSLAHGTADAYSDIDLRWVVPDEAFPGCLEPGLTALAGVQPVELVRFDPDFLHSDRRRLLFVRFTDVSLFWRLDLAVCTVSVAANPQYDVGNPAARAADDEWSRPASALANAISAIKAVARNRYDDARGLVDRGFERLGLDDRSTGLWAEDVRRLASAAAEQDHTLDALAARVRLMAGRELH